MSVELPPQKSALLVLPFVLGALLCLYVYFPGLMTEDSEIQLVQARSDTLADWHPIIMALIWRPIDAVVPGPLGMLLLFLGLYWGAFYMLTRQALAISRLHATAMSLLPFLPFLANFAGTIWKDVLVFGSFMAAIALAGTTTPARLLAAIIGFLLVWIGALARHNAGLAAVPILVLLLWPQAASPLVLIRRLCAAMAVLALLLLGSVAIMNASLQTIRTSPISSLFLFDLVGISNVTGRNLVPGQYTPAQVGIIGSCYEPKGWDRIWEHCGFVLDHLRQTRTWNQLFDPWLDAVTTYPYAYLQHRAAHVSTLFFVSDYHLFVAKPTATSFTYGFRADVTRIVADIIKGAAAVPGLRMTFTIGFWLLLSTALTVASGLLYVRGRMQSYTAFLISLSGFFYIAPLVVIGVAPDLRYAYFTIGATCVAVVYFIPSRVRGSNPRGYGVIWREDAPGGNQGPASLLQHPAAR